MADTIRITETITGSVDTDAGIIRGCKIVGLASPSKRRRYLPEALRKAVSLYEGVMVNIDHKQGDRSFTDRIGWFEGVHFREGEGLFGDFHFNPEHPASKTAAWWAKNKPNASGFSHVAAGRRRRENGEEIVEDIAAVASVDLVANPSTTKGFFESQDADTSLVERFQEANDEERRALVAFIESQRGGKNVDIKEATLAQLRQQRPDLVQSLLAETVTASLWSRCR